MNLERKMSNRMAVLLALSDEQAQPVPSETVIQCCEMFLGMTTINDVRKRHIDWQPMD